MGWDGAVDVRDKPVVTRLAGGERAQVGLEVGVGFELGIEFFVIVGFIVFGRHFENVPQRLWCLGVASLSDCGSHALCYGVIPGDRRIIPQ